jgi:hypothetical protein
MTEYAAAKRSSWQAWALLILFFGPLLAAWILYYHTDWRPAGQTMHGQLIDPAVPLLDSPDDAAAQVLRGHWTLLHTADAACGDECREALYRMRQTDLALGRRGTRLDTVLVLEVDAETAGFLEREHPDLTVVAPGSPAGLSLVAHLPEAAEPTTTGILLVDPLGNLMMRFDLGAEAKGMYEDLKKLMRISRIG